MIAVTPSQAGALAVTVTLDGIIATLAVLLIVGPAWLVGKHAA